MTTYHPRQDNKGKAVLIQHPSTPSVREAWADPNAVATVIPDGWMPASLNGIGVNAWTNAPRSVNDWATVAGTADIDEPPFSPPSHLRSAAGVVIEEADGRYWLVAPSNAFGGYTATFPKGTVEQGISLQAAAIMEAYEEAGLRVEILGYLADVPRSQSFTRYYRARRVGGNPAEMGWESQAVHLVPRPRLTEFLTNKNDGALLTALGEG
ncbi:NUDIX hydrolase [Aromatoleum evansii]|uniref:NUDIX hydrolase n=1 Tax=Aromatoleum evansii TaxID=59406 RepID=UPI00145C5ECA|nr:NUDIX hydrolase [Aromatoleum evansii]NMG31756.1 NUDIX domain-containing protein [Aromatoleum evansii]